jgi:hypothetical protein
MYSWTVLNSDNSAIAGPLETLLERAAEAAVAGLVGDGFIGTPVGMGILHPILGEATVITEVTVVLTIIGVALFGSTVLSERAFRLLRWIGNRPEPPVG